MVIGLCLMATLTRLYRPVFQDDLSLWTRAVRQAPEKPRPWVNYGLALSQRGLFDQAATAFKAAHTVAQLPHVPTWDRLEAMEAAERNLRALTLVQLMAETPKGDAHGRGHSDRD